MSRFFLVSALLLSANNFAFARGAIRGDANVNSSQGSILDSSNVIELKPGVQVFNRDLNLMIKLDNIQDSRCPIDPLVACFWPGNVKVSISIISRSELDRNPEAEWDKVTLVLGVNGEKADVLLNSGYVLKLVQVLPLPEINAEVIESPVVILTYEKADANDANDANNDQVKECDNAQEASPTIPGIIELKNGAPISNCNLNLELKLVNIADSRCPIGALCFWQGSSSLHSYS